MASDWNPTAYELESFVECAQHVLNSAGNTLLVMCSSRESLLQRISSELAPPHRHTMSSNEQSGISSSSLLHPTIRQIARSKNVRLAFAPTLMHFRAYLSALAIQQGQIEGFTNLAILNVLELHRSTSEFSAQGISRTLALIIDIASQKTCKLQIMETSRPPGISDVEEQRSSPFQQRVPILNSSMQAAGDDRDWAGRTIEVGAIICKWVRIVTAGRATES